MINVAGFAALRDGFTSVGGSNLQSYYYWSSSEYDSGNAWLKDFEDGYWAFDGKGSDDDRVRACLEF